MAVTVCATCRQRYAAAPATECETCQRHRRYGAIVAAIELVPPEIRMSDAGDVLEIIPLSTMAADALEALADLMIDRVAMTRRHNREMRDESIAAQRDAREAYQEGAREARDQGDGFY